MDTWGYIILIAGFALYFLTKQKYPAFLYLAGVGTGIVVGAYWVIFFILPSI